MGELQHVPQERKNANQGGVRGKNERMLDLLTSNPVDKQLFYTRYWKEDIPLQTCLREFQLYKIGQLNLQFNEFNLKLHNNDKEALELLFQEPVDSDVLLQIRERLIDKTYTAQTMYEKFKENVGISIMRFTHKRRSFR